MSMRQFEHWLEKGKSLADDLAKQKPSVKRKVIRPGSVRWRNRDSRGYLVPKRKRSAHLSAPRASTSRAAENNNPPEEDIPIVHNLEYHLDQLAGILKSVSVPSVPSTQLTTSWAKRQLSLDERLKTARPILLNGMLGAEKVFHQTCQLCNNFVAVIQCMECIPSGYQFLCSTCDVEVHQKNILHNRETTIDGFLKPIPPNTAIFMDELGQHQACQHACLLPIPLPKMCSCFSSNSLSVVPGKQVVLVTFNGAYKLHLPVAQCPGCSYKWTPTLPELVAFRYWPATTSCQTLYTFDVFRTFEQLKIASPAFSQRAFIKMLEHRGVQTGREGTICGDTFHRSFREFVHCSYKKDHLCLEEPFSCPACTPDMLAVSADGNRKHYRFRSSKGTDEVALFDGLFIAKDREVEVFVESVRTQMPSRTGHSACGPASFKAGRETSMKSSSKIDEEGLQIAVCRHGLLLKALNHYRGEIFAYPMFLHKELSSTTNVTFFCTDITCKYWPYLEKVAQKLPELQPLTIMKPFLSVMHAKAHTSKCEVKWGGRSQAGAGNTIGEEVEQVNSFLSRAALTTKYMSKAGREDMITMLAIGWNHKKVDGLHKALASRYIKSCERVNTERLNLEAIKSEHNLDDHTVEQWLCDVKQWAETERASPHASPEELRQDIEALVYSYRRKKHSLYRQNDSNQKRQSSRRRLNLLKAKLREALDVYNSLVPEDQRIEVETACNLSARYLLPWETHGHTGLRLKRQVFDQVMVLRRFEEEKEIVLKEMMHHCLSLQKNISRLDGVISQTMEDIKNREFPVEMTEDGYKGLLCCLLRKVAEAKVHLKNVTTTYMGVATNTFGCCEQEQEEDEEQINSGSELSDDYDDHDDEEEEDDTETQ